MPSVIGGNQTDKDYAPHMWIEDVSIYPTVYARTNKEGIKIKMGMAMEGGPTFVAAIVDTNQTPHTETRIRRKENLRKLEEIFQKRRNDLDFFNFMKHVVVRVT